MLHHRTTCISERADCVAARAADDAMYAALLRYDPPLIGWGRITPVVDWYGIWLDTYKQVLLEFATLTEEPV